MRIFTFEGLDFGFSERYRQKLAKNCAKYILSIKEKSDCLRQVSEKTEVEDLDLSELRILVLGFRPTVSDVVARKFHSEKLLVKEASKIEVPGRFSKPTKTIPIPLLYIYKKKAKVQIAAKLIKLLSELYVKLADCYANLQFNLTIGSYWQVLAEYKSEIKALGEALFIDINDKFPECIRVHGLLLDQFFITKLQQELFLEDTLHMPSVEKKDLSIAIENDTKLEFNVPDDQAFSDSFLSKICESNVSLSTLCSEQTFPENTIEVQDFSEPNKTQAKRLTTRQGKHCESNAQSRSPR